MSQHVKKGDLVMILAGDDKGKTGEVLHVYPREYKVLVQGTNKVFKHLKPSRKSPKGGRITKEMPISMSNVLPVDPKTSKATRVKFQLSADGAKERMSKSSGQSLGTVRKVSK